MPVTSNIPPRAEYQQVFTSSGTWRRPSGVDVVWVAVQGAGGGGGGGGSATDGSRFSGGGGGPESTSRATGR